MALKRLQYYFSFDCVRTVLGHRMTAIAYLRVCLCSLCAYRVTNYSDRSSILTLSTLTRCGSAERSRSSHSPLCLSRTHGVCLGARERRGWRGSGGWSLAPPSEPTSPSSPLPLCDRRRRARSASSAARGSVLSALLQDNGQRGSPARQTSGVPILTSVLFPVVFVYVCVCGFVCTCLCVT